MATHTNRTNPTTGLDFALDDVRTQVQNVDRANRKLLALVDEAFDTGATWQQLASALGLSGRQSAYRWHRRRTEANRSAAKGGRTTPDRREIPRQDSFEEIAAQIVRRCEDAVRSAAPHLDNTRISGAGH